MTEYEPPTPHAGEVTGGVAFSGALLIQLQKNGVTAVSRPFVLNSIVSGGVLFATISADRGKS